MLSFLKTLLIIIWAYYGLKLLLRLLRPFLMRYVTKKLINKFQNGTGADPFGFSQAEHETRSKATKKEPIKKTSSKVVGEYVDFEEIDD
ncbi:MAG: hypothetical protein ABR84_06495 [Cryomorphaceae bacterium BACL21 MAG-121220-bin10]|jgi:hypothetical protein|nr:MAG: hypothetical protein ABR84_06495 [Cryomorphaceae bacterium BACL21 MAG-121220-bin10]MDB9781800.1 DUF4834 family protein [Winogradskyella sp.]|tara:strand:+ start:24882 stop:25148 length:267 start_codon:yes stop_codon:yes gene_type:complete